MEEVQGIPGKLPTIAPFPTPETRRTLPPQEWQACLEAWIFCVEFRLRLLPEHFHHFKLSHASSGISFLNSYFQSWDFSHESSPIHRSKNVKEQDLHRRCLLLLRRLLLETGTSYDCSPKDLFTILANASTAFGTSLLWTDTLQKAWQRQGKEIVASMEETRTYLIKSMTVGSINTVNTMQDLIQQASNLSRCLPQAGKIMMTGSDYLDCVTSTYTDFSGKLEPAAGEDFRRVLTENSYICLKSLMADSDPSTSVLLDDLYWLKANAEGEAKLNPNRPTLLSSLVCSTTFIRHLEVILGTSSNTRGDSVLHFLRLYRNKMSYLHRSFQAPKSKDRKRKGKARARPSLQEMHIHKAAQLSQIHELFHDTPTPYILRLLDHFSDDVEAVTAALLEPESLPTDLQVPQMFADQSDTVSITHSDLAPRSTPPLPADRRNVFDDDDFDRLRISTSQVHIGRKERTYDEPSNPSENAKKKAAIMAALAVFDSDDDERDDTYDVADVGGAVDNTVDTDARPRRRGDREHEEVDVNERTLFKAWRSHPEIFARDSKTRISKPRQELKRETGMGDEQIEGWAIMLERDDAAVQKLENKYTGPASFGGQQKGLAKSKWSANAAGTGTEEDTDHETDGADGPARGPDSGRGRSFRGSRGYGRGKGSTSGDSHDVGTQAARKRKEQGRGRGGANHNRREGRARKIGRGFGSLPPG
jgi:activating signal cointegrator complex subunit 2